MPNQRPNGNVDFFIYGAEFLPLNLSATATQRIQISSDADFLMTQITGDVRADDDTEAIIANPAILLQLTTSGQRDLSDRPIRWEALVGTAKEPYILPQPKLLPENSVLEVKATQGGVAASRVVRIYFHGWKIFK